jgi:hypothetical protein
MNGKVIRINRRTKKGRTAAEAAAVERDKKITDVKHLQGRIMSLTQVIHALLLEREDPDAPVVYQREELVTLNPEDVSIIVTEHARPGVDGRRDADVTVKLLTH